MNQLNKKNNTLFYEKKERSVKIRCDKYYKICINIDGVIIGIDHWNPDADLIFISHAHMDHIPNIPTKFINGLKNGNVSYKFICSKITKDIIEIRKKENLNIPESSWILGKESFYPQSIKYKNIKLTLIKNGHCYGSTSLLIEGSEKLFCTGDFITEDRQFSKGLSKIIGLKPVKCDHLITECTYGNPKYSFPSFNDLKTELNQYISKSISEGNPIVLLGYPYGKSQNLLKMITSSYPIILEKNIAQYVKILENNGIKFPEWKPYNNYKKKKLLNMRKYILLINPYSMFSEPFNKIISSGAKTVFFSGKSLAKSTQDTFPVNKYILLSDHCDFSSLYNYIKKCEPKYIYLHHGETEVLSYYLSKYLKLKDIFYLA